MTQYRISKAALNMAMQEIAVKGKDDGIHVLCLVPGWVRTDMGGPNGRLSAGLHPPQLSHLLISSTSFRLCVNALSPLFLQRVTC